MRQLILAAVVLVGVLGGQEAFGQSRYRRPPGGGYPNYGMTGRYDPRMDDSFYSTPYGGVVRGDQVPYGGRQRGYHLQGTQGWYSRTPQLFDDHGRRRR